MLVIHIHFMVWKNVNKNFIEDCYNDLSLLLESIDVCVLIVLINVGNPAHWCMAESGSGVRTSCIDVNYHRALLHRFNLFHYVLCYVNFSLGFTFSLSKIKFRIVLCACIWLNPRCSCSFVCHKLQWLVVACCWWMNWESLTCRGSS